MGMRLKRARLDAGLTQEKLAEKVDISVAHLSRIENGKEAPSLSLLIELMNFLEVSPNRIMAGYADETMPELLLEVQEIFEDCDSCQIQALLKVLRTAKSAFVDEMMAVGAN